MNFLTVSGICKKQERDFVLKDISFKQQKFRKIALAGETGSGKSTLLKIIAGLVQPDSGEVFFEEQRVPGPEEKLLPGHPRIAYLSQHFELRNNYKVLEVLEMASKIDDAVAGTIYEVCRINHLLTRRTEQLSGGEKQRIAVARLLIASPKLLLLDEPYSNLDIVHKNILRSVIKDISDRLMITCILVSHDPLDLLSWADEIMVMKDGRILQNGTPEQIYKQPDSEYIAGLFGAYNIIRATDARAFMKLAGNQVNGKNILVRPENSYLTTETSEAVSGKVHKVVFLGSFYELEVLLSEKIITVRTRYSNIVAGDIVYVSVSPADIWYI